MPDTQLQQALNAVTARLKTITTANGYDCDLGGRVYLGRMAAGEETSVPYVSLWQPWKDDGPEVMTEAGANVNFNSTAALKQLLVVRHYLQGFAAADDQNPTWPAYTLQGCIEKCLGAYSKNGNPFGVEGLIRIELGFGLVRPAGGQMSPNYPYCIFTLDMILSANRGNPYA